MRIQIPDEAIEHLRHLLDRDGAKQWEIGRFISTYWQATLKHLKPGEVGEAHANMIRDFAVGTGADKTTLRDRENMWSFFSDRDREKYDMLTYHQFRALKYAGVDDWERWAEWALVNGYQGRPASVARIRKAIAQEKDPLPLWMKRLEKLEVLIEQLTTDEEAPTFLIVILLDTIADIRYNIKKELA